MKKSFCFILFVLMLTASLFGIYAGAAFDSGTLTSELHSKIYYMESLDEGTVFFEKDADKKVPAAAFVKLVAAGVAIEKWPNLESVVEVTEENLSLVKYDYGVRVASYKPGERITRKELIDCLVVHSANDAASIIAYEVSSSLEGFIAEMQTFVEKAGCTSTVIKNIHGFDEDGQYTTAADVAKIIRYANKYPAFNEALSAKSVTLKATDLNNERTYSTGNKMVNTTIRDYYHESVTAGKYTSTEQAGECIAVISNMEGYSYLTVVMGGVLKDIDEDNVNENTCMTDTKKMLDWVYENIRYRVVVAPTQSVAIVGITAGKGTDTLSLVPEKETSALVPSKVTPASVLFEIVEGSIPEKIVAPINKGDALGRAKVYYAGQELAEINLVAGEDVSRSTVGLIMSGIKKIVGSKVFLIISLVAFLGCGLYFAYMVYTADRQIKKQAQSKAKKVAPNKKAVPVQSKKKTAPLQKKGKPSTGKKPTGKK